LNSIKITFIVDSMKTTVAGDKNKTVLDTAIENDIDAPYSCKGGACATCIAKLKSGSVELEQNYILTDSEIDEGMILTCQAYPTSNELTVDIDDI
jgi:ring-1,2-phenylacetyl-CoA epoxidase subunit PaaE